MMKRILTIFLAMLYFLVSTGLTLDMHYCSGELVNVQIIGEPGNCCSEFSSCEKKAEKDCCSDETVLLQSDHKQIASTLPLYKDLNGTDFVVLPQSFEPENIPIEPVREFYDLPPPPPNPLWLLYSTFTFYG